MVGSNLIAAGNHFLDLVLVIRRLGKNYYKSTAAWKDFPQQVVRLQGSHSNLQSALETHKRRLQLGGLDAPALDHLKQANKLMKKEERRLLRRQERETCFQCVLRTMCCCRVTDMLFPDQLGSTLRKAIAAYGAIDAHLKSKEKKSAKSRKGASGVHGSDGKGKNKPKSLVSSSSQGRKTVRTPQVCRAHDMRGRTPAKALMSRNPQSDPSLKVVGMHGIVSANWKNQGKKVLAELLNTKNGYIQGGRMSRLEITPQMVSDMYGFRPGKLQVKEMNGQEWRQCFSQQGKEPFKFAHLKPEYKVYQPMLESMLLVLNPTDSINFSQCLANAFTVCLIYLRNPMFLGNQYKLPDWGTYVCDLIHVMIEDLKPAVATFLGSFLLHSMHYCQLLEANEARKYGLEGMRQNPNTIVQNPIVVHNMSKSTEDMPRSIGNSIVVHNMSKSTGDMPRSIGNLSRSSEGMQRTMEPVSSTEGSDQEDVTGSDGMTESNAESSSGGDGGEDDHDLEDYFEEDGEIEEEEEEYEEVAESEEEADYEEEEEYEEVAESEEEADYEEEEEYDEEPDYEEEVAYEEEPEYEEEATYEEESEYEEEEATYEEEEEEYEADDSD